MLFQTFTTLLILFQLVAGQTSTKCNPTKRRCPAPIALGGTATYKFETPGKSEDFPIVHAKKCISYGDDGITFKISKSGDNPTIQSKFYIMFGRIEATVKAAPGRGIVSSVVLQSEDLDEIDLEWLGGSNSQVETNYFTKGDTSTTERGKYHGVDSPQTKEHNYTVDWTKDKLSWYIDDKLVRTVDGSSEGYPQTPMAVRIGSWAGGDPSNSPGTIEWAGGQTDYTQGPFKLVVGQIKVVDYSTGSHYGYADQSGKWTSIRSWGGKINGNAPK